MSKKKNTYSEIEYDNDLSYYYFKELDEEGNLVETYENINKDDLEKLRISLTEPKSAKTKKKQREAEVDDISSMIDTLADQFENPDSAADSASDLPLAPATPAFNFKENRSRSEVQAKGLLKELLKFYLTDEFISENKYIRAKLAIDQLTLTGLINQLKLSEAAIEKLMENINAGESHPRMFEVLSGMQRVYIDLLKTQSLSIIAAEEHMKKLKNDFDYYQGGTRIEGADKKEIPEETEGTTVRGTKGFLKDLHSENDEEDAEDIEFE